MKRISEEGLDHIVAREGEKLRAYLDGGGVWTIGVGHTRGVKRGMTCTVEQSRAWLRDDVLEAEASIRYFVPEATLKALPQSAYDALVSFVFNLGRQSFVHPRTGSPTGLLRALNARFFDDVPKQFMRWVYDNGVKVKGLENRRADEAAQWRQGFKTTEGATA